MKFNGKCKIRLLRDFPAINLRMGDSLTVYKYKYKKCSDEITYVHPRTYLRFTPEDVKELSDDAKEYEFKVFMGPDGIDGSCLGKMHVTENSADEAYSVMLDIIGCRLVESFPELDIPYSIELVEESEDE